MTIGVIGTGAMGSVFGGLLADAGEEVHLFDVWEAHVRSIQTDGLRIDTPEAESLVIDIPATTDPASIGPVDVAIVFVKTHQLDDALPMAAPMLGPDTIVVTLQNGLSHVDRIARTVPRNRIVGGASTWGAEVIGPGHVRIAGRGVNTLGCPDHEAAERIGTVFDRAGLDTRVVEDPIPYIWQKQFVSVGLKPVAALTELRDGPIAEFPPTWSVVEALIEEAMTVARAKGIEIVSDDPIAETRELCLEVVYDGRSSMLEDVINQRATEIDFINGAIVEYGEEEDVPTPVNRVATALVKSKEQSYLENW